jgi:preprotein translocase SecE subunit
MINPIHKIRDSYNATVSELKKCTWPNWHELWESTLVVIVSAIVLSLFVLVVDLAAGAVIQFVT